MLDITMTESVLLFVVGGSCLIGIICVGAMVYSCNRIDANDYDVNASLMHH